MKRSQLLGNFYYRKLVGSDVFFGYLYQTITLGHDVTKENYEDGPEALSRSRLILTVLSSFKDLRFYPEFYSLIYEFLGMFRCYLSSKYQLSKEIYELSIDVFEVSHIMMCYNYLIICCV